ncbi:MAG: hypothetical protein AAFR52_13315 [Pseudomonadota bacterium]
MVAGHPVERAARGERLEAGRKGRGIRLGAGGIVEAVADKDDADGIGRRDLGREWSSVSVSP